MRPASALFWKLSPFSLCPGNSCRMGRWMGGRGEPASWLVLLGALWAEAKVMFPWRVKGLLGWAVASGRGWPAGVPILLENRRSWLPEDRQGFQPLKMQPCLPWPSAYLQLMPSKAAMSAGSRKVGMDWYSWQRCSTTAGQQGLLCTR